MDNSSSPWIETKHEKFLPKFYYMPITGQPILTVCLLLSEDFQVKGRGVAVRSANDNHCRKTGRNKALGRAVKAVMNEESSEYVYHREDVPNNDYALWKRLGWKSEHWPYLTKFERKIVDTAVEYGKEKKK
ncbi:hypothetical protein LCGC14_1927250 [marine sediment metagenome]|uniref:Uncharacterized protein n=1 Tax=marine sediment metagenome TaxID=412755 RepID=A0A0F9I2V5_9ZZZZ